jgi:hypothetical protein
MKDLEMNLNLEYKFTYDIVEATLKDYEDNPERYVVASDKRMAIRKRYTHNGALFNETRHVTLGITKNRSQIYIEFTGQYSTARQIKINRPWLKDRSYHNNLIAKIRKAVREIKDKELADARFRDMDYLVQAVREAIPGALESAVEEVLIKGSESDK